jgi:hypothetical protein
MSGNSTERGRHLFVAMTAEDTEAGGNQRGLADRNRAPSLGSAAASEDRCRRGETTRSGRVNRRT